MGSCRGGGDGTIIVSTDNGNTWNKKNSGTNARLQAVACNTHTWIVVGDNGTILRSQDTVVWQP